VTFSIPNLLSLFRLATAPLLALVFLVPENQNIANIAATALFLLAASTDFWDGFIARRINQSTSLGALLDLLADKLLIVTALLLLLDAERAPVGACIFIVGRELLMSALREWVAQNGKSSTVRVIAVGKWKTGLQMTAVPFLFYAGDLWALNTLAVGVWLLWAAAALSVWSMLSYCLALWRNE
jgi:CDP-diacylglycerol--glycerol-3-phosphate 3-phosphatidyltransferase